MKFATVQSIFLLSTFATAFNVQPPPKRSSTLRAWNGPSSNPQSDALSSQSTPFSSPASSSSAYTPPYTYPSGSTPAPPGSTSSQAPTSVTKSVSNVFDDKNKKSQMKRMWDTLAPVLVQGGSLRTWAFATEDIDRVNVMLRSDGRPLHANLELWQGPDNTPVKMNVYNEDGSLRQFAAIIETPNGQNSIAIRNTGQMEFPLSAAMAVDAGGSVGRGKADLGSMVRKLEDNSKPRLIQGGAVQTFPFDSSVASVQVMITTDGRPLNARIELLQGPNNIKQVIDLYCEDGKFRPFYAIFETPGSGNVIRVVNTATLEFPMNFRIEPYEISKDLGGASEDEFFNIL